MAEECTGPGWDSFPPELLRRVVSVLLGDWAYFSPDNASDCLRPIRATCTAWRSIIDADIKQLTVTVPSLRPACLAENFPNATHLDLSRYHLNSQDIFSVLEQLKLRSLVLADPWNPPVSIPTQFLQHLTYLSFLAEGLLVTHLASQFCEALVQLKQLEELQLSRLQLSAPAAQMMAQSLTELPKLNKLGLSGGATPMHMAELYVLLNVDMPQLRTLELMRLGVRMLPRSLSRLVSLTRLAFSGEMMRSVQLQDELLLLTNLKVLDISANLAEQLPGSVLQLTGLQELHAGMNRLGMQAHNFAQMEELETLVLASNKLLALHSSVWALTTLKRLDLGHNNLSDLPAEISSLTGLTYLNVCHNFLTALPAGLAYLTLLVELDISLNTDMRELPSGLGALSLLTRLTASHMRLKQLPTDIGGMVALAHLDVSHNSLHHLAPQLSSLVALTHLEASDNKLHQSTAVPEELATLTALKVLRLARNRLQSLPEALGAFSALQVLDCSGNRLTSVPRVVGRCTALQQLLMSSNRLRGLTSGIGNLMRLQLLDLSHNQYRHLPTMTGDLTQLQELLLADNQLEDLPSSCSSLLKVTQLTLHSNRLHVLPPAICRMSGLRSLTLHENPLLGRDAVVLQLQRQLPGLSIDNWKPLQGAALPVPQFGASVPGPPFMNTLLAHLQQHAGVHQAAVAAAAAAGPAAAPAAVPAGAPPQGGALGAAGGVRCWGSLELTHGTGPGAVSVGYAWPALVDQGYVNQGYDVRDLEAAMYAQVNSPEQQQPGQQAAGAQVHLGRQLPQQFNPQQQQQQQQQQARLGRFMVMQAPAGAQGGPAYYQQHPAMPPGAVALWGHPMAEQQQQQQQQQYRQPWATAGPAAVVGFGPAAPGRRVASGFDGVQAAGAAAAGQPPPPPGFSSTPAAAAAQPELHPQPVGAAAAAPAAAAQAASDAAGSSASAGGTPWASAGSQPGMNLQQLLADVGSPAGQTPPQQSPAWMNGPTQQRQRIDPITGSCVNSREVPLLRGFHDSPEGRPQGARQAAVEQAGAGRWQEGARGPHRPWSRLPARGEAGPSTAAGMSAAAAAACRAALGQPMAGRPDDMQEQQVGAAASPITGPDGPAAASLLATHSVQADDALSSDSMHSSHVARSVAAVGGPAAAAGARSGASAAQAAAAPAGAAAEEGGEDTPSSAADTECGSDTSSDVAEGGQVPRTLLDADSYATEPPSVVRRVRGAAASSSAGGSSSGGGAQHSKGGASSSGGCSSSGGHSSSGGLAPGGKAVQARPSRLQPQDPAAAAPGAGLDPAAFEEEDGSPESEGEECCHGAAASAAAGTASGGLAASTQQAAAHTQEGRSGRYFPFNVLEGAWWGS